VSSPDHFVISEMIESGGSFVKAIGRAALIADPDNLARLKQAFPELWKHYNDRALTRYAIADGN
jgi:hypothetical protein